GAECVVTRCRVSGNPLLVLRQRKALETLVSKLTFGFFCSATKETRRRSGGTTPFTPIQNKHRPETRAVLACAYFRLNRS
ncbi:MAG: hypothetical protein J6Q14_05275, partial [Oscillospiraceae bacterium]|nr:hypothetical protein [Oscillospiraceae bacterium]